MPVHTARPRRPRRAAAALLAAVAATAIAAGCGSDGGSSGDRPDIVVTTTMLGAVVQDLVGDTADVQVLMPDGVDPHDFQPSAQDAAAVGEADLVVQNGLDLEEGLGDTIAAAKGDGVPVFSATDHVTLREFGEGEHSEEEHADEGAHAGEEEHEHGPEDPHIWMDPIAMRDVALALAPVLNRDLGLDLGDRSADLDARLDALDGEIRESLSVIPETRRKLVTGHESMGYFADRYDFELIGALIPSLSSQSQVSASNLAELRELIEREDVPAIFNETGTPEGVAEAIGDQTGARVVEIASHNLPDDGSYFTFMRDVAAAVEGGLTKGS